MHIVAREPLVFLDGMYGRNEIAPPARRIVVASIRCALGTLINYIECLFRSEMLHEINCSSPCLRWDSVVVQARITFDDLQLDPVFIKEHLLFHTYQPDYVINTHGPDRDIAKMRCTISSNMTHPKMLITKPGIMRQSRKIYADHVLLFETSSTGLRNK